MRAGNLRELGCILHSIRHVGAVEIRSQSDMLRTREFHRMVDVVNDLRPLDARQIPLFDKLTHDLGAFKQLARLVFAAEFPGARLDFLLKMRVCFAGIPELSG